MLTDDDMATEYHEGEWHVPTPNVPEPWAVVTYAAEPSSETGHVGWCWWALGRFGDADSCEEAKQKAEKALFELLDGKE